MPLITGVDCSLISMGAIAAVCGTRAVAGTNSSVVLGNYSDIDRDATVVTNNVISSFVLQGLAYEYVSYEDSTVGSVDLETGTYFNDLNHTIILRVFVKNQDVKDFVDGLLNSTVFAILDNKEIGTDKTVRWEVYGFDSGLKVSALTATTEMTDGVVYEITLTSPDNSKEATLPKTVWAGTTAATETMLRALVTPPTP